MEYAVGTIIILAMLAEKIATRLRIAGYHCSSFSSTSSNDIILATLDAELSDCYIIKKGKVGELVETLVALQGCDEFGGKYYLAVNAENDAALEYDLTAALTEAFDLTTTLGAKGEQ